MPQYKRPGEAEARSLDAKQSAFLDGEKDGSTADKYIRLTVVLASILFLVGISTHFPYRGVPLRPVGLGIALLVLSLVPAVRACRCTPRTEPSPGRSVPPECPLNDCA
jgi:hypothetical protein